MDNPKYRIGDFVILNHIQNSTVNGDNVGKRVTKILNSRPDALVVVNITDDGYLLSLCWNRRIENLPYISVCGTDIYYTYEKFYHFKEYELIKSTISNLSYMPPSDVSIIRQKRNEIIKQKIQSKKYLRQKRLQKQREKSVLRKKEREEQIALQQKYKPLMEFAVINNDRKEMQRIIKIVGYDPRHKRPSRKRSKSTYIPSPSRTEQVDIPNHIQWAVKHPYQGGGFSGK